MFGDFFADRRLLQLVEEILVVVKSAADTWGSRRVPKNKKYILDNFIVNKVNFENKSQKYYLGVHTVHEHVLEHLGHLYLVHLRGLSLVTIY